MSDIAQRQLAQRRIEQFQRSIQSAALAMQDEEAMELAERATRLASHAALAVAFDPGLLHLLRINFFFDDERLPYWTEARLLLSPLCRDAEGSGLYVMEAPVRELLLARLAALYGPARLREVATLLWQYTERRSSWVDRPELKHAQQLTALNFLAPERALAWLDEAEGGSGSQGLPKAWFVAMRSELPALPAAQHEGDPAAVCAALQNLDFIAQRAAHRDALKTTGVKAFVIGGPRDHAQRWLLLRLLKHREPAPALIEFTLNDGGSPSVQSLLAGVLGLDASANLSAIRAGLAALGATRPVVIALQGVQRRGVDHRAALEALLRGDLPLSLYVLDDADRPSTQINDRVVLFPRIVPFVSDDLRYWLDRHGEEAGFDAGQPTRPAEEVAEQVIAATGGQPQRVLEHLCMRCGVAWPEVLAHAEAPYTRLPFPHEAVAELAQLYETRRADMPAGAARTREMEDVVSRMRQLLATREDWPLQAWTESERPGMRLAAAVLLQLQPRPALCAWLGARMASEKPFVAYHSVVALMNAARTLPVDQLEVVSAAVQQAVDSMSKFDAQTDRADVLRKTQEILAERRSVPPNELTVLPLRDAVLLPGERMDALVTREEGLQGLSQRINDGDGTLFAVWDMNPGGTFEPSRLARVGTVAVASALRRGSLGWVVTLEGKFRAEASQAPHADSATSPLHVQATRLPEVLEKAVSAQARAELMNALRSLARIGGTRSSLGAQLASGPVTPVCYALAGELQLTPRERQDLLQEQVAPGLLKQLMNAVSVRIEAQLPERFGTENWGLSRLASLLEGAFVDVERRKRFAALEPVALGQLGFQERVERAANEGGLRALAARALALLPDNEALWEHVEAMSAAREDEPESPPEPRSKPSKSTRPSRNRLKLWPQKSALRIRFTNGEASLRQRVMACAAQWFAETNLRLEVLPRNSKEKGDIRIAFATKGPSWSYVGIDARSVTEKEPTMQLAVGTNTPDAEFNRTVLKQFGHALGLLQEHQNPNGDIEWNVDGVIEDLKDWSRRDIDNNLLKAAAPTNPPYRSFDPESVMLQEIPGRWLRSNRPLGGGTELSASDKAFIARLYPPTAPA